MLKQSAGEIGTGKSVRLSNLADIVHRRETAAATHGLNRDRGVSWNVAGEMLSKNPTFDICRATGGEVDNDVESLALIERALFGREGRRPKRGNQETAKC